MLKESLNQLIDIATSDDYSKNIIDARKEYQSIAGNIYEDDKSYENRISLFLEWYIFDRIYSDTNQTLIETLLQKNKNAWSPDMLKTFESYSHNIHGLFIVKKIKGDFVKALNLFDNSTYVVNQSFGKIIFNKNLVFEGRLVPYDNSYYFTGSFCFHPDKAIKFIKSKTKYINKINNKNKKELKAITKKLDLNKKKILKIELKIDDIKSKILKSSSTKKILQLNLILDELELERTSFEKNYIQLESEVHQFTAEKIILGPKILQTQLIQKLSYMQLVWERSRLIDLNDIYKN